MAAPEPLNRASTAEALSDVLRKRILNGDLEMGARLPEVEISAAYQVGRYTTRAAFQDLIRRGLAVHVPNRGVSVLRPDAAVVSDIYTYRTALECEAARILATGERPLDDVEAAYARLVDALAGDWATTLEADLAFHRSIVAGAGSPRMLAAFDEITDQVMLCLASFNAAPGVETIADDHQAMLDLLRARDAAGAELAVRKHLQDIVERVAEAADQG